MPIELRGLPVLDIASPQSAQPDHKAPHLAYDLSLLRKAKDTVVSTGMTIKPPELAFTGLQTPRILFHGFKNPVRAERIFTTGRLNPDDELLWFSRSFHRSARDYGMEIKGEELREHPENPYQAKSGQDSRKLVLTVFPHEQTNLGQWLEDKNVNTLNLANNQDYITNTDGPLYEFVIVRLGQLQSIGAAINRGEITTKDDLQVRLGITEDQQAETRAKIKAQLGYKAA